MLSLLSAVLQVLPFPIAGPVPYWRRFFCWFCLTPMLLAIVGRDEKDSVLLPFQAAILSYCSGVLWYLGNDYWIYPTMHVYGGIASPAALGILLLFSLYVGLYHGLFGYLLGRLRRSHGRETALWLTPVAWVGVELARARITGFPWDLLGYTQVDNLTLTQLAPWTGVMGLSFVIALGNVLWLARIPLRTKYRVQAGLGLAILFAGVLTLAARRSEPGGDATTATALLLQENIKVGAEAPEPGESVAQLLSAFRALSMRPGMEVTNDGKQAPAGVGARQPDLIVWPEAPNEFRDEDEAFRQAVGGVARDAHAPVISDSITLARRPGVGESMQLYNSASFFTAAGDHVGRYNKMHLVPFGEYTPYKQFFFFAGHLLDNVGPFIPGTARDMLNTNRHHYGVFICYESIFGDEIREFAHTGADVLVNISDDGWYGDSSAPWEHLDMVRMRALENHRWVLRATNTGVTASVDPHGRIAAEMPRHIRSSMLAGFAYHRDLTFYARHGDWLGWMCAAIAAGALVAGARRQRQVH